MAPALDRLLRAGGRRWRRWIRRWRRPPAAFVYAPSYGHAMSAVPMDPLRSELILTFLFFEGLIHPADVHRPAAVSIQALRRVHGDDYLEQLSRPGALTRVVGVTVPRHQHDRYLELQRAMVGGTVLATEMALASGRVGVNLGGGLHHAHADRGQGFCLFNDVAVAVASARGDGFDGRVLVIDLDLHDGDGTRTLFADDPLVHTFSICNRRWADGDPVASTTIELGGEVDDDTYLRTVRERLPPAVGEARPDLVFYIAGCDPAADDRIGDWRITADGMLERDRLVWRTLDRRAGEAPRVVLLGGGYGTEAWRYSARFLAWMVGGRRIEPPSTEVMTLERYRLLADMLRAAGLLDDEPGEDDAGWGLSEEDILPALASPWRPRLFLDHYSYHHMEVVLERTGLFDRLRGLGFEHPTLEVDLDNPAGHTLRVFAGPRRRELLAELRASRDRRSIPGREMLRIEWLLLQNPRTRFRRPPLPGQRHPGLGMLRDAVALLILVCERLDLDGLLFVPSHYHLAATARGHLRFVDPEDEGRFRALAAALEELPLAEAARAVEDGRVVDAETGEPLEWEPAQMVLPLSGEMREQVSSEDFEERARRAAERYRARLVARDVAR